MEMQDPVCHDREMSHDITVRRMDFRFPDEIELDFSRGKPELSFGLIGLSLLLPYLEPYLIRTMKKARERITDPDLLADVENFSAQEGQHYRQHIRFNRALRLSGCSGLEDLEKKLEEDYLRFSRTRSLRFNLAYAEGFEALTTAFALFSLEGPDELLGHSPGEELLRWHAIEELEHRTVAFDVYEHVFGGYFYRLFVGLFAQWHFLRFVRRTVRDMKESSPDILARHGGREGRRRRRRTDSDVIRRFLPRVLKTYLPWYTPHDIVLSDDLRAATVRQTEHALSTSRVE